VRGHGKEIWNGVFFHPVNPVNPVKILLIPLRCCAKASPGISQLFAGSVIGMVHYAAFQL
jgi:hypothetical protein